MESGNQSRENQTFDPRRDNISSMLVPSLFDLIKTAELQGCVSIDGRSYVIALLHSTLHLGQLSLAAHVG